MTPSHTTTVDSTDRHLKFHETRDTLGSSQTELEVLGVMRNLPDFIIIGAAKSGTTALARYLSEHPEIFMSEPKELQFFSSNYNKGLDWYSSFFAGAPQGARLGEASPQYSRLQDIPSVPKRIHSVIPQARLIYLVRDPLARIRSHYAHWLDLGQETRPLNEAVVKNQVFLNASMYWTQLSAYLDFFPRRQVLVLDSEALLKAREHTYDAVCAFLEVSQEFHPPSLDKDVHIGGIRRTRPSPFVMIAINAGKRARLDLVAPKLAKSSLRGFRRRQLRESDLRFQPSVEEALRRRLLPEIESLSLWMGTDSPSWTHRYLEPMPSDRERGDCKEQP